MIYQNPNYCMGNRSTWQKLMVALGILKNPWMLLLDKVGFVKAPLYVTRETAQRSSLKFVTRGKTTDINDAVVVLSGKEYPPELTGLNELLKSDITNPVVLDCGGHIGSFSMYIKSHWPKAKILALEPVPDNLELFKANIARNNFSDVTVIPFALYGEFGTFYIDLAGKQFDAVNITSDKPSHNEFITIEAKTLDQVISENNLPTIDLMKLDIEGAEYYLFEHSTVALSKHVRRIIMEFHPAGDIEKRNEIVDRLCKGELGKFELVYETKNILGFQNLTLL